MAAGRFRRVPATGFAEWCPTPTSFGFDDARVDGALAELNGRQLVIVARDAHRHEWERSAVEALLAAPPTTRDRRGRASRMAAEQCRAAYVATYGAARVNVEAAAERLYSRPRRGVEQSGSSPGS